MVPVVNPQFGVLAIGWVLSSVHPSVVTMGACVAVPPTTIPSDHGRKHGERIQQPACPSRAETPALLAKTDRTAYLPEMAFTQIDHWIGNTLFVPPIIKICHLTRQSQFAVARMFWFVAALNGLYHADTLIGRVIWGGMSIVMMITAVRRADRPAASLMFFRLLAAALLIFDILNATVSGAWQGAEFWIFVLFAEYAAAIRNLPPTTKTKPRQRATEPG